MFVKLKGQTNTSNVNWRYPSAVLNFQTFNVWNCLIFNVWVELFSLRRKMLGLAYVRSQMKLKKRRLELTMSYISS